MTTFTIYDKKLFPGNLIELVKEYPVLYNPALNKDRNAKNLAWEEIASRIGLGVSAEFCEKKWVNLRDTYTKEMKKEINAKLSGSIPRKRPWYLLDEMSFLKVLDLESGSTVSSEANDSKCLSFANVTTKFYPDSDPLSNAHSFPTLHYRNESDEVEPFRKTNKSLELFLMSLLEPLEELSLKDQSEFRVMVTQYIHSKKYHDN